MGGRAQDEPQLEQGPAPVIAVVGPSGVGKDSLIRALAAHDPGYRAVRRVITRPGGAGEAHIPVSPAEFARIAARGGFALHWRAHGLRYGIPGEVDALCLGCRGVLVNLSWQVLAEAQARFGDLVVLSLSADPGILAARLARRGRESGAERSVRLKRAGLVLPEGLRRVHRIDTVGTPQEVLRAALACLQPESGSRLSR
ncbi:MAG: phosphonate metabolism protein/1,5-bisphosphokinase (PRPP-forming) PhnN [Sedimentitalea sp.]|nr:phosphonate metabolism protein/1,5-bisphosphokinase (PRPP-forming) PhnN [Sedimentitalea sp.]